MSELLIRTPDEMLALGERLAKVLRAGDLVTLEGPLGSGKTQLARGVLRGLGFEGEVPSPTFSIVQDYGPPQTSLPVAHSDLYRVEDADEIPALALDEYLEDGVVIVEWPALLPAHWRKSALNLSITVNEKQERILTAAFGEAWEGRWPPI